MFDFGKRNIINMNYTRYLALPKVWVDAMRLEKGDQVKIEMDTENRLIISAVRNEKPAIDGNLPGTTPIAGYKHTSPNGYGADD